MLIKEFELNSPQAKALLVNANKTFVVWARGTGKTTGVLAPKSLDMVHKMPRAKGGFIGKDYEQIMDRTLPEIVSVWDKLGYKEGIHWRLGKPLPDWETALIPPMKWDHVISWYNGSVIMLLSLAVKGISNGLSMQWIMGDEAKFWDLARLKEVLKAVRGLRNEFGHLPEYLGQWFSTDKWVDDIAQIQWVLDKKKQMNVEKIETIYALQLEVNEIRREMEEMNDLQRHQADQVIHKYEEMLNALRRTAVFYSEAAAKENEVILGPEYRKSQQMELTEDEFKVAIENEDPGMGRGAFYPALKKELHYYESDADIHPTKPFIIALDYQSSISPVAIAQFAALPGALMDTLNFPRNVYALHPKGLKEACIMFCEKFRGHGMKEVYYVYDHTAIGKNPFGVTYKELVIETLTTEGWIVVEIYIGKAPEHGIKFEQIKNHMSNNDPMVAPPIRINALHNEELKTSLERTRAISMGGKVTEKDKTHENTRRYPDYPQQYATHFPDTFDQIIWATHELKAVPLVERDGFAGGLR